VGVLRLHQRSGWRSVEGRVVLLGGRWSLGAAGTTDRCADETVVGGDRFVTDRAGYTAVFRGRSGRGDRRLSRRRSLASESAAARFGRGPVGHTAQHRAAGVLTRCSQTGYQERPLPAFPQVIPEGVGPVKSLPDRSLIFSGSLWTRRGGRRGLGSRGARPRSGRQGLRPAPFGARCGRRRRFPGGSCLVCRVGAWRSSMPVSRRVGKHRGLPVIPSPPRLG